MELMIVIFSLMSLAVGAVIFAIEADHQKKWVDTLEKCAENLAEKVFARDVQINLLKKKVQEARKNDHRDSKGRFKKAPKK